MLLLLVFVLVLALGAGEKGSEDDGGRNDRASGCRLDGDGFIIMVSGRCK
jgi:hypothetical protein